MFSIEYDEAGGFIRCRSRGFHSPDEVREHVRQATAAIERCRRLHEDVKMLIECDGQVQSVETMKVAEKQRAAFNAGPYDRRAFVLPSSLLKMQVGRLFTGPNEACFLSENAAITWLLAERESRAARATRAA